MKTYLRRVLDVLELPLQASLTLREVLLSLLCWITGSFTITWLRDLFSSHLTPVEDPRGAAGWVWLRHSYLVPCAVNTCCGI